MVTATVLSRTLPEILDGVLEPVSLIAKRRTGKRPSPPTVWRWCRKGLRGGVKLTAVHHSGCFQTTEAAFDQFLADQTRSLDREAVPVDDDSADAELRSHGLL